MKFAIVASTIAAASALTQSHNYYEEKFYNWMTQHNIEFKSGAEFAQRLAIFAANDDLIETHNAAGHSYQLGHNAFSHMTFEEFKATRLGATVPAKPVRNVNNFHGVKAADSVDWTTKGAVSGVKDQGQCGSCWAFSTVGSMEGAYAIKTGSLQTFSEQQLVDCDHNGDLGCMGGLMDNAFEWIASNNGLCSEDAYPYFSGTTTKRGTCQTTCSEVAGSDVATWTDVAQTDAALEAALTLQPVSVAIEADQAAFQLYKSGVFTATCGTNIDHGVLAVGYGTYTDGNDYWKVKNSWGTSWGMDGYILLARGISQVGGQCGILTSASYPTLANLEFTSQL